MQPGKERLLGQGRCLLGALGRPDETCLRERMSTAEVGARRQTSAPREGDVSLHPSGLSEHAASQAHQSGLSWGWFTLDVVMSEEPSNPHTQESL